MSSVLDGLAVDPASDRAVFRQIADQLRSAVRNGRLNEGDRLPSEAQLMDHYRVARMTIRNALQLLEAEGLTRAEHGRGVYVRRKPPVRRIASDRFARRHRKEGKAAFLAESEQAGAIPDVVSTLTLIFHGKNRHLSGGRGGKAKRRTNSVRAGKLHGGEH